MNLLGFGCPKHHEPDRFAFEPVRFCRPEYNNFMSITTPLYPGQVYHVYNRGINRENIFFEDKNYYYFLELYARHIAPVADTFAYSLLKNHFHFMVRIKEEPEKNLTGSRTNLSSSGGGFRGENLTGSRAGPGRQNLTGSEANLSGSWASRAFANFFNAYAKGINKTYERTGALFQRPFGRRWVYSNEYFLVLIAYIHQNPQKHGLIADFQEWPFSSFKSLVSQKPTRLARDEVLEWFQGREQFIDFHRTNIPSSRLVQWVEEDDR